MGMTGTQRMDDAMHEARATMAGKWGPMIWSASLIGEDEGSAVAASVVVQDDAHRFLPLLAFVVTNPEYRRRGLGQRLIQETILRLDATGSHELHLAVRSDNPAVRLCRRLGFHEPAVPDDHS